MKNQQTILLGIGICCREWPIQLGMPWGNCKLCGKRPEIDSSRGTEMITISLEPRTGRIEL